MEREKLSANEIRIQNRQRIYQFIRENYQVSKQDVVVGLQLSLPTVTQNLEYLRNLGLIDTSKKIRNTGGRNAMAYTYVADARMAIGVYLSANHMGVVALNLSGEVVCHLRESVAFDLDDDAYLQKIGRSVEEIKQKAAISDDQLLGVGIAVPGLISNDGESVTYGLTLGFTGKTRSQIAKYIPYPTRIVHDSYAAGYMETWIDGQVKNAFYISLSNSIGGAMIIDNAIYEGDSLKGGEIGHMTVVPEGGELCYCGKRGCFDTLCRASNLDCYTNGNLEEFFRLLENGDKGASELWEKYLDDLSLSIHNIRILFDGTVILGGYVGAYIGDYMEELNRRVDDRNPFGDKAENYLRACRYKVEATAAGAAIFFVDHFLENV